MRCKKNNMEISTNCSNNLAKDLSVIFLMYNISLTTCNSPPENAFTYHRLEWMSLQHILPKLITDIVFPPFCWGGRVNKFLKNCLGWRMTFSFLQTGGGYILVEAFPWGTEIFPEHFYFCGFMVFKEYQIILKFP